VWCAGELSPRRESTFPIGLDLGLDGKLRELQDDRALVSELSGGLESVKSASRRRAVDRRSLIVRLELW